MTLLRLARRLANSSEKRWHRHTTPNPRPPPDTWLYGYCGGITGRLNHEEGVTL